MGHSGRLENVGSPNSARGPQFSSRVDSDERLCVSRFSADELALQRTLLANQRTLLSYSRTALGLFGTGVALVKLFEAPLMHIIGYIFMPVSAIVFGLGLLTFRHTHRSLTKENQ